MERVDVAPEREKRAERAALASAARLAHCSISSVTSTLSTLYCIFPECIVRPRHRGDEREEDAEEEKDHRHGVEGAAEGIRAWGKIVLAANSNHEKSAILTDPPVVLM